jgi:hypothetical protein
MKFSSSLFWFRDYWSKRYNLERNKKKEGTETDPIESGKADLTIKDVGDSKCNILDPSNNIKLYSNLVNPSELLRKYEPYGLMLRSEKGNNEVIFDDLMKQKEKAYVSLEPIAQFRRTVIQRIMDLAYRYLFIPGIIGTIWFESFLFRIFSEFVPLLDFLYFPYMIFFTIIAFYGGFSESVFSHVFTTAEEAETYMYLYDGEKPLEFYKHREDIPVWLDSKPYWVFLYKFTWAREFTVNKSFPFFHFPKDLERIELWVDAKTGNVEWIVTDYHFRELWYKPESKLEKILVQIKPNFHTLLPVTVNETREEKLKSLYYANTALDKQKKLPVLFHPASWVVFQMNPNGGSRSKFNFIASYLSNLWWWHWRYPLGTDSAKKAKEEQEKKRGWLSFIKRKKQIPLLVAAVGKDPPVVGKEVFFWVVVESILFTDSVIVRFEDGIERLCATKMVNEFSKGVRNYVSVGSLVLVKPDRVF